MVGCKIRSSTGKPAEPWLSGLLRSKFFDSCGEHGELRKNEKNLYCIDCKLCICKHCAASSSHDRILQICKYVYHDVVRLHDIQKLLDCSLIQAYKINGEKAVHLNPRPQIKDAKSSKARVAVAGGTSCEACGRHIQDFPNRFCSIACKVSIDSDITTHNKILSTAMSNEVTHLPNMEAKQNSNDNGSGSSLSLSESSSSEVIQAWLSSAIRPRKMLHKRKSFPRRAPMW